MTHRSGPDLLTLHAVRLLGYAATPLVAGRFGLTGETAEEHLLDAQALGRVSYTTFGEDGGWSLTEAGRTWNERQLSAELDHTEARPAVERTHDEFRPHNIAVTELCTAWQLTELEIGEATTDLDSVTAGLSSAAVALAGFETTLTGRLDRFAGYHRRFRNALDRLGTDPAWIAGTDRDSCHRVWFEFHEDLIATLGVTR